MKTFSSFPGSVCIVTGLCLSLNVGVAEAGSALSFDGVNDFVRIGSGLFPTVTNTFTMEVWANPTAARAPTPEEIGGFPGTSGQRYAIFPDYGREAYGSDAHAGAGISIGTNGASVFELTGTYPHLSPPFADAMPPVFEPVQILARVQHPVGKSAAFFHGWVTFNRMRRLGASLTAVLSRAVTASVSP